MMDKHGRRYRRLVPACAERDIGRTMAFELARRGLLETFRIGTARYVFEDSLDELPAKLAAESGKAVA